MPRKRGKVFYYIALTAGVFLFVFSLASLVSISQAQLTGPKSCTVETESLVCATDQHCVNGYCNLPPPIWNVKLLTGAGNYQDAQINLNDSTKSNSSWRLRADDLQLGFGNQINNIGARKGEVAVNFCDPAKSSGCPVGKGFTVYDGTNNSLFRVDADGDVTVTQTLKLNNKLDVAGQINASGGVCLNGNCKTTWPIDTDTKCDISGLCSQLCIGADCRTSWPSSSSSGGDITGVIAGTGLIGGGLSGDVTLLADTVYLQRRVSGTCPAGSSIRVVNSDGTVTCQAVGSGGVSQWTDVVGGINYSAGKVGIGTPAPNSLLHIKSSDATNNANTLLILDRTSWSSFSGKLNNILWSDVLSSARLGGIGVRYSSGMASMDFHSLYNNWSSKGDADVVMTLQGNGNVGIGTTTPSTKLEVAGDLKANAAALGGYSIDATGIKFTTPSLYAAKAWIGVNSPDPGANGLSVSGNFISLGNITSGGNITGIEIIGNKVTGTQLCIGADCKTVWPTGGVSQWTDAVGGINYSGGNVGIGTPAPNKQLHIKTASGNAEFDLQSGSKNHWAIYHDDGSESLKFWNDDALGDKNVLTVNNTGGVSVNGDLKVSGCFGPVFDHLTSTKYDGSLNSYAGANIICGTGSHMCTSIEILNSINCGKAMPTSGTAWASIGLPGFTTPAVNDCQGWTANTTGNYGAYWDFSAKKGLATSCTQTNYIACCK